MIRVFLLDDHEVVRAGLRELLQHEGDIEVIGESGSALEAARRIPALRPDVAVLDAIMAGASGYVLKQIRGSDLVSAVRTVASGQSMLDPAVTQRVLERIRSGVEAPNELKSLTEQERRILLHVAEGLTNREIAAKMFLAEKTVKNYVSSLLAKLGLERRTQAAVFATKHLKQD